MNFIFDVGNVLVEYEPLKYLKTLFSDKSVVDKMYETIFQSKEWLDMDCGILTHEEAIKIFCACEPEFQSEIRKTMRNFNKIFTPLPDTIALLPRVKETGRKLYYLSNIHKEIRDSLIEKHEFFNLFDGGVFSCDVHVIKPYPEIYRCLLEKYSFIPQDCIFFDDMEENVAGAEKEGIKGVLFTSADCVLEYL